MNGLEHITLD